MQKKNLAYIQPSWCYPWSIAHIYMASSVSGQDELNRALWLATGAGKMEPSCPFGTTRRIPDAKFHQKPYNKSFIDQVCSVKMAGYWPHSFFASLWTSTSSWSINTQNKNLANIQPSWPHTWSITHTYNYLHLGELPGTVSLQCHAQGFSGDHYQSSLFSLFYLVSFIHLLIDFLLLSLTFSHYWKGLCSPQLAQLF